MARSTTVLNHAVAVGHEPVPMVSARRRSRCEIGYARAKPGASCMTAESLPGQSALRLELVPTL